MKVVHISYSLRGGSGKNLLRHHEDLLAMGVDSRVVVGEAPRGELPASIRHIDALAMEPSVLEDGLHQFGSKLERWVGDSPFLNLNRISLLDHEWIRSADVVELRQVHSGGARPYFPLALVGELAFRKPLVWRLSDMWPFTGFCAYSLECELWKSGCGTCPQLGEPGRPRAELRTSKLDSTYWQWSRKARSYGKVGFTVVSPSRWMDSNVDSGFLASHARRVIPIGVNMDVFNRDRVRARERLGINSDELALLVIVPNAGNFRKAFDLCAKVMKCLSGVSGKIVLVVVSAKKVALDIKGVRLVQPGHQTSDEGMAEVYAACDMLLFTSRMDNSAQVLVEAGASGLATIAFDVGGNSEYVSEACQSLLVPPYEIEAFARIVGRFVERPNELVEIRNRTREDIKNRFSQRRQTEDFLSLYSELKDSVPGLY